MSEVAGITINGDPIDWATGEKPAFVLILPFLYALCYWLVGAGVYFVLVLGWQKLLTIKSVRETSPRSLLALMGLCLMTSTGCISSKTSNAIAEILVAKIVAPPLELSVSTMAFQRKNGRWPGDYAELRSFAGSETNSALTNYDRVDFTQKPDGSLEIYAVAPSMTNQMTLRLTDKSRK